MSGINEVMDAKAIKAVKLTPPAKEVVAKWSVEMDMSEQGVASRIIAWLGNQSDEIQRAVLGMYGKRGPDIARIVLEEMAKAKTRGEPQPASVNGLPPSDGRPGKRPGAVADGKPPRTAIG